MSSGDFDLLCGMGKSSLRPETDIRIAHQYLVAVCPEGNHVVFSHRHFCLIHGIKNN